MTVVEEGALDLQGGDVTLAGGLATTGTGVVRNGTLSCTVPFAVDGDWNVLSGALPNLDASVTVRRLVVDFGRTAENPVAEPFKTIVIGTYAGAAPSLANWRVTGTGLRNVRGVFEAKDGRILLTLEHTGLLMLVR